MPARLHLRPHLQPIHTEPPSWVDLIPDDWEPPQMSSAQLREALERSVAGQQAAIQSLVHVMEAFELRRRSNRRSQSPLAFFAGQPGTGRERVARAAAQAAGRLFVKIPIERFCPCATLNAVEHRMPMRLTRLLVQLGTQSVVLWITGLDSHECMQLPQMLLAIKEGVPIDDPALGLSMAFLAPIFIAFPVSRLPDSVVWRRAPSLVVPFTDLSTERKVEVAERFLIPEICEDLGVPPTPFHDGALRVVIDSYTMERGASELKMMLSHLLQRVHSGESVGLCGTEGVTVECVEETLGAPLYQDHGDVVLSPGIVSALAVNDHGGFVVSVECTLLPGHSGVEVTGLVGPEMQDSAVVAWTAARRDLLELDNDGLEHQTAHLHVAGGDGMKDGASAGLAFYVAIMSCVLGFRPVERTCVSGEVTIAGRVRGVDRIEDKLEAVVRSKMRRAVIPAENIPAARRRANRSTMWSPTTIGVAQAADALVVWITPDPEEGADPGTGKPPKACGSDCRQERAEWASSVSINLLKRVVEHLRGDS